MRTLRLWLIGLLENTMECLPHFLRRPVGWVIAFFYFASDVLVGIILPGVLTGLLIGMLPDNVPLKDEIPVIVVAVALLGLAWRQYFKTEGLREKLEQLEREMEEEAESDYSGGEWVEG